MLGLVLYWIVDRGKRNNAYFVRYPFLLFSSFLCPCYLKAVKVWYFCFLKKKKREKEPNIHTQAKQKAHTKNSYQKTSGGKRRAIFCFAAAFWPITCCFICKMYLICTLCMTRRDVASTWYIALIRSHVSEKNAYLCVFRNHIYQNA